jgi:hypothetical protein
LVGVGSGVNVGDGARVTVGVGTGETVNVGIGVLAGAGWGVGVGAGTVVGTRVATPPPEDGCGVGGGGMEVDGAGVAGIEVAGTTVSGTEVAGGTVTAGVWVKSPSVSPQATAAMATSRASRPVFRSPPKIGKCNIDLAAAGKGSPAPCRLIIATA